jgi:TRAP-type mannitol/chloroaromatic compound transport system permease large subunit
VRGALYLVVLLTATLFGIAAGTVGATVVLLGIMAGPMMIKSATTRHVGRRDHRRRHARHPDPALGDAGGDGPVLGVSVLQLYAAAFGPASCSPGMYIVYTMTRSFFESEARPAGAVEDAEKDFARCSGNAWSGSCRSRCSPSPRSA